MWDNYLNLEFCFWENLGPRWCSSCWQKPAPGLSSLLAAPGALQKVKAWPWLGVGGWGAVTTASTELLLMQ